MRTLLLCFASFVLSSLIGIVVGAYIESVNAGTLAFAVVGMLTIYIKVVIDYAKRD